MWEWADRLATRTYRKWRLVSFADKLNVCVAVGSLTVGVMAVVLTISTLRMTERQGKIAERQAEIAEKQFNILQQQLEREAEVELDGGFVVARGYTSFNVRNKGLVPVTVTGVTIGYDRNAVQMKCADADTDIPLMDLAQISAQAEALDLSQRNVVSVVDAVIAPSDSGAFISCAATFTSDVTEGRTTLNWTIDTTAGRREGAVPLMAYEYLLAATEKAKQRPRIK